ncbi:MAG: CocE/NonD family hydrolase [Bacteroidia bacterium]|nr:CocE/NonD family hydrolase [Bacteroidia bacterium]
MLYCTQYAYSQEDSISIQYVREHYWKAEYQIPMRDGSRLFTSVYLPKDSTLRWPILLLRTPYSVAPYGENEYTTRFTQIMHLVKDGYIFVFQDVRGRFMSEGNYEDIRPHVPLSSAKISESSDTYDTIEWLLKNVSSHNGKVGMMGISYPGFYCTAALPEAHSALVAVSPQAPVTDWFIGDDFHHNGVFSLMDAFDFYYVFGRPRNGLTKTWTPSFQYPSRDNYDFHLKMGAIRNYSAVLKDSISFWNDLMKHSFYDSWWKARNIRVHLTNIKPAVLTVGGLFDAEDCFGTFATYQAIEKQNVNNDNFLLVGPWFHGGWHRSAGDRLGNISFGKPTSIFFKEKIELPFFQHYLKDTDVPKPPEVTIFVTGENQWYSFGTWPPKQIQNKRLYLYPDFSISFIKPIKSGGYRSYLSDPFHPVPYTEDVHLKRTREYMTDDQRFASRRTDVLTFQTNLLQDTLKVTGPIIAELWVSSTGTDADFIVKVIDVFPDSTTDNGFTKIPLSGYQQLVRGEIMRARFREGFEKEVPLKPNTPTQIRFTLPDVAHAFLPGHKLMVQIQSSWFPLFDRNPQKFVDVYTCLDSDFQEATQTIWLNKDYPTSILIPIFPTE